MLPLKNIGCRCCEAFFALSLSACDANIFSIYRRDDIPENESYMLAIDAKQRIIYKMKARGIESTGSFVTYKGDKGIICSEPLPDALSAFSQSTDFSGKAAEYGELAFKNKLAESAAKIGIRTAAIQVLRDSAYRECEALASGVMNTDEYKASMANYKLNLIALFAIENLAGSASDHVYASVSSDVDESRKTPADNQNKQQDTQGNLSMRTLGTRDVAKEISRIARLSMATNAGLAPCINYYNFRLTNPGFTPDPERDHNLEYHEKMNKFCDTFFTDLGDIMAGRSSVQNHIYYEADEAGE